MTNYSDLEDELRQLKVQNVQIEKDLIEVRVDLKYVKENVEKMNNNLSRILFIIGGGFIASIIGFIVSGGLLK